MLVKVAVVTPEEGQMLLRQKRPPEPQHLTAEVSSRTRC